MGKINISNIAFIFQCACNPVLKGYDKFPVTHYFFHVQVLVSYNIILVDYLSTCLMQRVNAWISNFSCMAAIFDLCLLLRFESFAFL